MNYLITGGVRSGKSSYAQKLALSLIIPPVKPIYLATSRVWDEDFSKRIERHKKDRSPEEWTSIEIEKQISSIFSLQSNSPLSSNSSNALISSSSQVIVVDCITLWLTNIFTDCSYDVDRSLKEAMEEMSKFLLLGYNSIFITNELGMGGHAETEIGRKFSDLQGWFNQYLAGQVDEVVLLVSGIPVKIK